MCIRDRSLTKGITQQMFTELTKGADVHTPTITPEMISAAVTQLSLIHIYDLHARK